MIHVVGHLNPDSDAICTAFMAARWLNMRGRQASAWRLGEPNRETQFLFERAGLDMPPLLTMPLTDLDVWLVDFTEPAQGPETLMASNIVGIIDHHRLGGLVTRLPPEVWIKPVGSSATLLWQLMSPEDRAQITSAQALLLLGAILSDTVTLRSPTTTADAALCSLMNALILSVSGTVHSVMTRFDSRPGMGGVSGEEPVARTSTSYVSVYETPFARSFTVTDLFSLSMAVTS